MKIDRKMVAGAFRVLHKLQLGERWHTAKERVLEKLHGAFLVLAAVERPKFGIRMWLVTKSKAGAGGVAKTAEDFLELTYPEKTLQGETRNLYARVPLRMLEAMQAIHLVKRLIAQGRVSEGEGMHIKDVAANTNQPQDSLVRRLLHPQLFERITRYLPRHTRADMVALYPEYRAI